VTAHDYETGEDVTIELDPRLSPSENLERYFKRYHKGLVGTNILGQQLEITRTHINELEQLKAQMAGISRRSEMRQFADQPAVVALRKKHTPEDFKPSRPPKKVPEKKDVPNRLMPKRYRTSDGLEVWVGKSDEGNDYLTTKLANGNDWFFHVEGYPGSHTILRTGGRKDPPQESVLEAAELCAHFSKLKDARKLDVHVAPIKQVHKPKGARPIESARRSRVRRPTSTPRAHRFDWRWRSPPPQNGRICTRTIVRSSDASRPWALRSRTTRGKRARISKRPSGN
jgi:predicted ribosome quality control (RQC) complex YloA/Tae2 family protein